MKLLWRTCLVSLCAALTSSALPSTEYLFTFDPARTYTDGTVRLRTYSEGTFQGSFDPIEFPLGTQTKVGEGGFGLLENDSVTARPFLELARAALVRTAGTFVLDVDRANLMASVHSYSTDRLPDQPLRLGATVALNNEPFRTLRPTASFARNQPAARLGLFSVDRFTVNQRPGVRSASLIPISVNRYVYAVTFMATVRLNVVEFGQTLPLTFDIPHSLVGIIEFNGQTAVFGHPQGRGAENVGRDVDLPLRPFPFAMQSGGGLPASFWLATTIKRIQLQIAGVRRAHADGIVR